MGTLIVLILAIALIVLVSGAAKRAEKRPRLKGRSIYRGAASHVNIDGRPKKAYATKEAAETAALTLSKREGRTLRAYACSDPRCGAFHIGHG